MSALAVEAKSLSSLTALASNPPAYPRNPTHVRHDPLVLYIARVPGSRDVFLSPMKPRDKVVTAEDIQSSLYYIHVNQPEDARLITPPEEQSPGCPPTTTPIARKAIPGSSSATGTPAAPQRKPLPGALAAGAGFDKRHNIDAPASSQSFGNPGLDYGQRRSLDSSRYLREERKPPLPPRRPTTSSSGASTCLTLIRRDPASTAQWNVASIEDPLVHDISSSTLNEPNPKKRFGAPVYITVTNPGYSKFLGQPEKPELLTQASDLSVRSQLSLYTSASNAPKVPFAPSASTGPDGDNGGSVFQRRLWMEASKSRNNSDDFGIGRETPRRSGEAFPSDLPAPGTSSPLTRDGHSHSRNPGSDRQPGFRGYVFMSPWNGRCEFLTGVGGGSLKCRHVIPGLQGATPLAMPVSELRFNLPSSSKAHLGTSEDSSKRSSIFHRPRHTRNNSAVSEMDLSLGQEFAGGGYGGKQAKLGKLIIEDEGLKMMDLLVAANMALWWRAYEKVDAKSKGDRSSV